MSAIIRTLAALSITLAALFLNPGSASAQQTPAATPGITVQERGPVHEAFAQPLAKDAGPTPVVPKQPPPPIPEERPGQKPAGDNVQWIPGYWAWDLDRNDFLWVSGVWRNVPPDRKWAAGHWEQGNGGWQWVPGFWAASGQGAVQYLPEPPASVENGPSVPAPDVNSFYVPGIWRYGDAGYRWRPGFWHSAYDGWVWNSACYHWSPAGYNYVDGFWDYPLARRGLLFAPVYFDRALWATPGWAYRPGFAVNLGIGDLFASLFVRPGYGHYYFGDYYDPFYAGRGFHPWYSYGRRYHDPLYSYYGWRHRGDPGWHQGLHDTFSARRNGTGPRGPSAVAPLSHLGRNPAQLRSVVAPQRTEHRFHEASVNRGRVDRSVVPDGRQSVPSGNIQRRSFYAAPSGSAHFDVPHSGSRQGPAVMPHISAGPAPRSFAPAHAGPSRPSPAVSRPSPAAHFSGGRGGGSPRGGGGSGSRGSGGSGSRGSGGGHQSGGSGHHHK